MIKAKKLDVLFAATEMAPYAKEGGLADVMAALPQALHREKMNVSLIMPGYEMVRENFETEIIEAVGELEVQMGDRLIKFHLHRLHSEQDVDVILICNGLYFERPGIYNNPDTGEGYIDNPERFIFFQKAVLKAIAALEMKPDILHCNDFHTGLLAYYAKRDSVAKAVAFNIHNLAYQGIMKPEYLQLADIEEKDFYPGSPFEYWGEINSMKVGLEYADAILTVSPSYAAEIQTRAFGVGLEGVLKRRSSVLTGILNGADYQTWNPEIDKLIKAKYSAADIENKAANKRALQREFGLPQLRKRVPLLGMIGRLVEQKGLDLLIPALEQLMLQDLQVVILGTGSQNYHEDLAAIAARYPKKLGLHFGYDESLAHLLEAGSDIYLMPSRFEPCGLNQLYSLRYGTIPVVHAVGGLRDSVIDIDQHPARGNGYSFDGYEVDDLLAAIARATERYADQKAWEKLMQRAMKIDFSWQRAAKEYALVYRNMLTI
jgi:starch synthase